MIEYAWRCDECGYDFVEAIKFAKESQIYCGMCAGDTGEEVLITRWIPSEEDRNILEQMKEIYNASIHNTNTKI